MDKVFLDTNVVVDFLCERELFYQPAAMIVTKAYRKEIDLCCSPMTLATASYLMERGKISTEEIFGKLSAFMTLCYPTPVDKGVIDAALSSDFTDFEDAMQYYSAKQYGADIIITRDATGFLTADIPCLSPIDFLG